MKTYNKGLIKGFTLINLALATVLFSCQKINTKTADNTFSDEKIILIYSQLGEIHNLGLDYVFSELQKQNLQFANGSNSKLIHDMIYNMIDNSVIAFTNKSLAIKNIDLKPFIEMNNTNNPIKDYLRKDLVSQIKSLKQAENLSNTFFVLMTQLNILIDSDAPKFEFDKLMRNGISILTDFDEKSKFVSCTSIGYSSLQYWKQNVSKWQQLFSTDNLISSTKKITSIDAIKAPFNAPANSVGTAIGKADITGIITGGVGGCVWGAAGGSTVLPVVGTLTGCAALGASGAITVGLGNSAKSAVESFVNWLTS